MSVVVSKSGPLPHRSGLRKHLPTLSVLLLGTASAIAISRFSPGAWDDAYISFVYVKNFAAGNGLTYNGAVVQGFTNSLWVLILSLIALLGADPPSAALYLSFLFAASTLYLTFHFGQRLGLPNRWALLGLLLVAVQIDFAYYLGKGLETTLFTFLLIAALGLAATAPPKPATALWCGLLGALLALCRPEGIALAGGAGLLLGLRGGFRLALLSLSVSILLAAPWFVWAYRVYGDWLPNPVRAKVGGISFQQLRYGFNYLFPRTLSGLMTAAFLITAVIALLRLRPIQHRALAAAVVVWFLFILLVGGDHMVGLRFLVPMIPVIMIVALLFAHQQPTTTRKIALLLIPLLFIAARWHDPHRWARAAKQQQSQKEWQAVGLWLKENAPPGSCIALNPAGIIPYYSGLSSIDMLGLNDWHIARRGYRDPALRIGHQVGDGEYVLSKKPDYILFGAVGSALPSHLVSDRQIAASETFKTQYVPRHIFLPEIGDFTIYCRRAALHYHHGK